VVGGGSVGCETAIHLATKGAITPEQLYFLTLHEAESPEILKELLVSGVKKVTVIEMAKRIAQDVGQSTRWVLMKELRLRGVTVITEATMKDIGPDGIVYTDSLGDDMNLPADTVVLAMGSRPEISLVEKLEPLGLDVRIIGDAKKCARIGHAIEDGFSTASQV
jgi:2,4-dienoyl-CoA reductase (NADPH2)